MSLKLLGSNTFKNWLDIRVHNLILDNFLFKKINEISQTTNSTNQITINNQNVLITTQNYTLAPFAHSSFKVKTNFLSVGDTVLVNLQNYSGSYSTNGTPNITVNEVINGEFTIVVYNSHNSQSLNGNLKIYFEIIRKW